VRAVVTLVERPWRAVALLLDRARKRDTITALFAAWLFLPLASPLVLLAVPSLGERFWAHNPDFWTTRFQYSLPIAPVLAYAAIDGARRLGPARRFLAVAPLVCAVVLSGFVVRPLGGLTEFISAKRAVATDGCLDAIPPTASVAASDRLVPHLTHRDDIKRLARESGQQYLAVAGDGHAVDKVLLRRALAGRRLPHDTRRYRLICRQGDVTVLAARA
jgi:hypothetical protein